MIAMSIQQFLKKGEIENDKVKNALTKVYENKVPSLASIDDEGTGTSAGASSLGQKLIEIVFFQQVFC